MKGKKMLPGIRHLLIVQLLIGALITIIMGFVVSYHAAYSALLGALVAIIPNAVFARRFFQYQGAQVARQIVKSFYVGEGLKIALSMLLFIMVFTIYKVLPLLFFLTYITIIMTHWLAPLLINDQQSGPVT